jgi:hypothetical protein
MDKEINIFKGRINRRTLMATAGVALVGGVAASNTGCGPGGQQNESTSPPAGSPRKDASTGSSGEALTWICDDGLENTVIDGVKGFQIKVRFTGYRGMPLNTISEVSLKIDGDPIDPKGMIMTAHNTRYKVQDLPKLGGKDWRAIPWLFTLDQAELFCPYGKTLSAGTHVLEGYMDCRGTYATAGRNAGSGQKPKPITKRLVLESV